MHSLPSPGTTGVRQLSASEHLVGSIWKMASARPLLTLLVFSALCAALYAQGVCVHMGKQYQNGEEWTFRRSFIMRCTVYHNMWITKIVACISMMGQRIDVGQQLRDQHGVWKCEQDDNGSTRLKQEPLY